MIINLAQFNIALLALKEAKLEMMTHLLLFIY